MLFFAKYYHYFLFCQFKISHILDKLLMNIKEQIGKRIQEARKAKGLTQAVLAEMAGNLTQPRINNWERGLRTPGLDEIKLIGEILDVSPAWLMALTDQKTLHPGEQSYIGALVPLLSHTQACEASRWIHATVNAGLDESISLIPVGLDIVKNFGNNLFALKIKDGSMEPELLANDVIIVSPDLNLKPGNFVVAKIDNDEEVIIRRYKLLSASGSAKEFELLAMNKHWPDVRNNKVNCEVLGTIIYLHRSIAT